MSKYIKRSYYVVMEDFGSRGLEATVHPEDTRRDIINKLAHGEYKHVAYIHYVDDLMVDDVTNELFDLAEQVARGISLEAAE